MHMCSFHSALFILSITCIHIFPRAIIVMLAFALSACDRSASTNTEESAEEILQEVVWDWDAFPQSSEMVLSSLSMDIQPKDSFEIRSEAAGIITLEVDQKVSQIAEGVAIARMNVDTLKEQAERLTIQEEKQILEDLKAEKLDLPEQRKLAKEELDEARRKVRMIELILKNPAMEEYAQELFGEDIGKLNERALQDAKDELGLAESKMAWADEFGEKIRKGQLRIQEMDLSKTKRQFEESKERSVYTTPFAGELRLELNYVDGQQEYTVTSRETIATLNNFDEIHAHLMVGSSKWVSVPPQQLYVMLADRNKTVMNFSDDRIEKDSRTRREERKYVFSIPLESNKDLKRLVGTQLNGDLIYRLPTRCYIVSKYDLSLYALGKTDSTDWNSIVGQLWPNVTVIAEGRKYLALARSGSHSAQ